MRKQRNLFWALAVGIAVGSLGGLIGLGGAEFRLPLLVGFFGLPSIEAVMINKMSSLVVVSSSLPARSQTIPWTDVVAHGKIMVPSTFEWVASIFSTFGE